MSEVKVNKISPSSGTAFTIGDSGDTFTVPSGATIVNSGTATGFGGGKILQVRSTTWDDRFSDTTVSPSWIDITGASLAITPASTSNNILIFISLGVGCTDSVFIKLQHNGSGSYADVSGAVSDEASTNQQDITFGAASQSAAYLLNTSYLFHDAPSKDSAFTYQLQGAKRNAGTWVVNGSTDTTDNTYVPCGTSSITLMELDGTGA